MENNEEREDKFKNEMIERFNNYPKVVELLRRIWEKERLYWEDTDELGKEIEEF